MKQKREEVVYGRVTETVPRDKINRRARQAKKFNRKLREIFRKNKGLANRE